MKNKSPALHGIRINIVGNYFLYHFPNMCENKLNYKVQMTSLLAFIEFFWEVAQFIYKGIDTIGYIFICMLASMQIVHVLILLSHYGDL